MVALLGKVALVVALFFITLNISCESFLAKKVSVEKSADILMGAFLKATNCFSLGAFKIFSLSLNFAILILMCHGVHFFGSICLGLSMLYGLLYLFPSLN